MENQSQSPILPPIEKTNSKHQPFHHRQHITVPNATFPQCDSAVGPSTSRNKVSVPTMFHHSVDATQHNSSVLSVQTEDTLVENVQYSTASRNYYSKQHTLRSAIDLDSPRDPNFSLQASVQPFEAFLHHQHTLQTSASHQPFLDRTLHSTNAEVNTAFDHHQKAFKRKNRAVDWILNQKEQDIHKVRTELYEQLQVQHAISNDGINTATVPTIAGHRGLVLQPGILSNEHWGDSLQQDKPSHHTRLYFQNIRGLQTSRKNSQDKWFQILEYAHQHSFDIFGLVETCTNTSRHRIRHLLDGTTRKVFHQANLCWATNDFVTDTNYRPGGTVVATVQSWVGRILQPLHDPHSMGRWSGNVYKLGADRRLFLFTAYRVCKQSPELGLISSYRQQVLKLQQRMPFESNLCPRKYFIQDFIAYVQSLSIKPNDFIIIMIDANEKLGEDIQGISMMMEKLGLVDTFTRHHQRPCILSTHHTSTNKRIDFMFSTANVLPHIESCGYLPFYDNVDTDHRGLFLELKPSFIDGQARIVKPPSRLVGRTTCKKELAKYKEYLLARFTESNILDRAEQFYQKAKAGTFEADDVTGLNLLDNEVTKYMLQAEKETCSAKPSFPWSPSMHQAALVIQYWTLRYRNRNKDYNISEQLQKIYDKLSDQQQQAIDTTTSSVRYNLHRAKIDKQLLQLEAVTKRRSARITRIEQEADFRETDPSFEAQRFAMIDETHHLFRYLEKLYGKKRSIGITGIEIPLRDKQGNLTDDPALADTWLRIHDPDEIVRHLIRRNIQHFGQAQGTAFTVSPIVDSLGFQGTGSDAEQLILNSIIPTEIHKSAPIGAQYILEKLADGNCLPDICDDISIESFWKGFQTWDEQTSTSPSGRHLGHYKALLMADGQDKLYRPDEDGHQVKENPSPTIQAVYFYIALAATLSGNTLQRWCNSSTMMIEKIPGQPRIHKLRVIHIFEADFNLMLKLLWSRRLVWQAHKHNCLNEAQAGSRPDHRCIDVVVRKTMNYTYAALTRTPLITIDNDAKACYDRIPCNLAMLVSRYFGMTQDACQFLATTLQQMKYRIRTAAGDSEAWYAHSDDTPIHGTGQGSCASPCLWLLISSVLMDCHDKLAQGMTQHDVPPDEPFRVTKVEGFVDDVSMFINPDYMESRLLSWLEEIEKLINTAEKDLEIWNMLLDASGGKLELAKCFWYLLCWYFNRNGDPVPLSLEQIREFFKKQIEVVDKDTNRLITLDQKDVSDAHRTLGAFKSVTGNESEQYDVLLHKSNHLAMITRTGQLSRFQARRAFSSIYIPSMTYSLVSCNLSKSDLHTIQSKAIQAFLPAMGYERTFPHAVVFASRQLGGLNLGDLYTECGIAKTTTILTHVRAQSGLGRIIRINLNWLQLHAGLSTP